MTVYLEMVSISEHNAINQIMVDVQSQVGSEGSAKIVML